MTLFHGGVPGLGVGDLLVPSAPHEVDGCPVCVARGEGRTLTVGEFRAWLIERAGRLPAHLVAQTATALAQLDGVPASAPIDPPSAREAVYVTNALQYARWYAGRSQGDLYEVVPEGPLTPSAEDHWPAWSCPSARIVRVVERRVQLRRADRRDLLREWHRRDRAAARRAA